MKHATALVLDPKDFTKSGSLRKEVFEAMSTVEVVVFGDSVIKNSPRLAPPKTVVHEPMPEPEPVLPGIETPHYLKAKDLEPPPIN